MRLPELRQPLVQTAVVGLVLALFGSNLVSAQEANPDLQNRLLQRSDGAIFIYKDGYAHPVDPALLGDSTINALPVALPVVHIDSLYAATQTEEDEAPPPPALRGPRPGEILYQADWSQGLQNWPDPADWQVAGGMLISSGDYSGVSMLVAPYQPPTSNYAVEAEIQWVTYPAPPTPTIPQACGGRGQPRCASLTNASTGSFGIVLRGDNLGQTYAGIVGDTTALGSAPTATGPRTFNHGQTWQTYRAEADGKVIRLLIRGVEWLSVPSDRLEGTVVGLWSQSAQVKVRAFRVIAL